MSDTETRPREAGEDVVERAFLIADVRGYTRFTREHGDAAAARLAGTFAALARDAVAARGGRVIELRGDEALAVFEAPRQAVRAAVDLVLLCSEEVAENPDLPLLVGVGVDAGPAVPLEGGFRGAAINTAARLCSQAAAGQVLVPATLIGRAGPVRGVVASPHAALELKGFETPLEVVLVEPATTRPRPDRATSQTLPVELDAGVPLAGRSDVMSWLRGTWRQARRGDGRVLMISGPEGIGRTRVAAELAALIRGEAVVRYAGAGGTALATAEAELRTALAADIPTLLVLDDLDAVAERFVPAIEAALTDIETRPALVLCLIDDPDASSGLAALVDRVDRDGDGHVRLGPLDTADVREIIDLYAGQAAGDVSVDSVMRASQGIPERVHRAMSEWAEQETSRRLEAAAEYLAAGRQERQVGLDFATTAIGLKLARLYTATPGGADATPDACPYKGLASFDDEDSDLFFGREQLVGELAARTVGTGLLAVVGASGSGKSSVLAAGLVPSLQAGLLPGSERWQVVRMRPGDHPGSELDGALGVPRSDGRLVLVVDQFEEVFAPEVDEAERSACVDALVELAGDPDRHVVVLGLRADFYGHCAAYPELARLVAANQVLVGSMTAKELRRAIELPARRVGVRIDGALADCLVEEVVDQPGGLPLLSTALVELWERRSVGWLRLEDYAQVGGVSGAVARLAESSYEQLPDRRRDVARALFLRLVTVGDEGRLTRRVVRRDELGLDEEGHEDISAVVERLTVDRLLTVTDETVEVAHEALLREWPRLTDWLREDAQGRDLREHLMQAARRWEAADRDSSELYRGTRLTAALDWASTRPGELNAAEQDFLRESRVASEREADRQRRTNRRLRTLLVCVSVVTLVAVAAGIVAFVQRSSAQHQATVALGRQLGAEAVSEPQIDRAMLLARQSLAFDRSVQTEGTLLATLLRSPAVTSTITFPITVRPQTVAVSPDGRALAILGNDALLHIYNATTRSQVTTLHEGGLPPVYMPNSNELFASPAGAGNLRLVAGHRIVRQYAWGSRWAQALPGDSSQPIVVSPDGRYVFLAWAGANPNGTDGPAYLQRWPVDPPGTGVVQPTVIPAGENGVIAAGAAPHNRLLVVTDGAITTWDMSSLRRLARTAVPELKLPVSGAVSPDGRTVAIGKPDGTVHFIDVATGKITDGSGAHAAGVVGAAFSPDSRVVVTTGDDGLAIVWNPTTGAVIERLAGHGGRVISAAFAGNRTLYTSSLDGTVLKWDLTGAHRFGTLFRIGGAAFPGSALPAAVSPNGRVLAVQAGDHGVRLFSVASLRQTGSLSIGAATVSSLAWSGNRLLVGTSGGAVRVWAGRTPRQVAVLRGLTHKVSAVAGSPDGHLAAAVDGVYTQYGGDVSGRLVVWRDGHLFRSVRLASPGNAVAFSRNGALLAVAKDSGRSVLVFDAHSGRLLRSMRPQTGTITLAFGSGDVLATGSWQGIITLWNAGTGAPIGKPALAAPAPVSSVAFDPSGTRYATAGGSGGGLRLWDTATQQLIGAPFPGGDGQWGTAAFTPDGRSLLVVFTDGSAYRWPISVDAWEAHACAIAGRNLTHEEWHRYVGSRGYQSTCQMYPPGP